MFSCGKSSVNGGGPLHQLLRHLISHIRRFEGLHHRSFSDPKRILHCLHARRIVPPPPHKLTLLSKTKRIVILASSTIIICGNSTKPKPQISGHGTSIIGGYSGQMIKHAFKQIKYITHPISLKVPRMCPILTYHVAKMLIWNRSNSQNTARGIFGFSSQTTNPVGQHRYVVFLQIPARLQQKVKAKIHFPSLSKSTLEKQQLLQQHRSERKMESEKKIMEQEIQNMSEKNAIMQKEKVELLQKKRQLRTKVANGGESENVSKSKLAALHAELIDLQKTNQVFQEEKFTARECFGPQKCSGPWLKMKQHNSERC
ncbi:unnamed protein product [Sphenostylis stenocarpa]|uniref:Uncharacterized protein n=1 Tax=Sphenostylis stenocarpa TaxID=92480 RepID=A0AA86RPW8_9FABA|nr:unnamed protein product [Sphenostylis stenocarpa]